jgi:hypothetical protein
MVSLQYYRDPVIDEKGKAYTYSYAGINRIRFKGSREAHLRPGPPLRIESRSIRVTGKNVTHVGPISIGQISGPIKLAD